MHGMGVWLAALCAAIAVQGASAAPPHLVVMLSDDHSYRDSSVGGSAEFATPNMARIAAAGMSFTQAFVPSPSCAPCRAALLTGLPPVSNGAMFNHQAPRPEVARLPAYLRALGYEVVAFGKVAHYAQVKDYGFDVAEHFTYHDDACVGAAVEWLEQRDDERPLCLMVGTNWPHVPWPPKDPQTDPAKLTLPPTSVDTPRSRQAWARYHAAVQRMDDDLGAVYDAAYRKLGDNTLFLHFSDHGAQWPFGKWNLYDAGLRVPLIATWPGKVAAGATCDELVTLLDVLPTLIDAGGGLVPPHLAGRSLLPLMRGETDAGPHGHLLATHSGDGRMNDYPMRAVRTKRWKYIRNLRPESEFTTHDTLDQVQGRRFWASWVRRAEADATAGAIVARHRFRPGEELYDLEADPQEQHNLAESAEHAQTLEILREELDQGMALSGDRGLESERTAKERLRADQDKAAAAGR
jgi:N-sulfoglucosamine sulfohydrolase